MQLKTPGSKPRTTRGFTLVELLITIAVVVIISTFIIRGMGNYLERSRDSARKQELAQIQQALTLYHNDFVAYPCLAGSYFVRTLASCGLTASYIKEIPTDKRALAGGCNSQFSDYSTVIGQGSQTYQLYAKLENQNDSAISGPYTVNSCAYNYKVENP